MASERARPTARSSPLIVERGRKRQVTQERCRSCVLESRASALAPLDAELFELGDNVLAGFGRDDHLVDVLNLPVGPDVEGPAAGNGR